MMLISIRPHADHPLRDSAGFFALFVEVGGEIACAAVLVAAGASQNVAACAGVFAAFGGHAGVEVIEPPEMRARLETFAADAFDAEAFVAAPVNAPQGGPMHPMARMVSDLAVIVPILEPAQRETLAGLLEKGPPMGAPGDHEHGPGPR